MTFSTNKNAIRSAISNSLNDIHALKMCVVPKATKTQKQQKMTLLKEVTQTVQEMDTDDFGIRVIIMKVLQ